MRTFGALVLLAGCDDRGSFVNATTDLEVAAIAAYRSSEPKNPDVYDPPVPPGGEAPMTWHTGGGHYWSVDVHLADGRVGTLSWAATTGSLGGVETPGDLVLDDEDAAWMFGDVEGP